MYFAKPCAMDVIDLAFSVENLSVSAVLSRVKAKIKM